MWTNNPELIARESILEIPEPLPPYDMFEDDLRVPLEQIAPVVVSVLEYPMVIHLLRVEDRGEVTASPSDDDDGLVVDFDDGEVGALNRRSRTRSFRCIQGVVDGEPSR